MARNQGGDWLRYENPDEKLPWLEPAEDTSGDTGPLRGKLIGGLIAVLAVIAVLVGGMSWFLNRDVAPGGSGEAGLIKAPPAPYKVPPSDPGGMVVEGQGDTVYAAGAGGDPGGVIDLTAIPEQPVQRSSPGVEAGDAGLVMLPSAPTAAPAPAPGGVPTPATPPPVVRSPVPAKTAALPAAKPAPKPVATPAAKPAAPAVTAPAGTGNGSYGLQLGAFSSRAKAESAWKTISGRFAFVGALDKSIEPVGKGDTTLYRLRAVGVASRASADNLCGRMKVSGDSCAVVGP